MTFKLTGGIFYIGFTVSNELAKLIFYRSLLALDE